MANEATTKMNSEVMTEDPMKETSKRPKKWNASPSKYAGLGSDKAAGLMTFHWVSCLVLGLL